MATTLEAVAPGGADAEEFGRSLPCARVFCNQTDPREGDNVRAYARSEKGGPAACEQVKA